MSNESGRCIAWFNAESRGGWLGLVGALCGTLAFIVVGQRPYGPVHLMGIGSGIFMILFATVRLLPGSCCLRICENGIVIRTFFLSSFIAWQAIREITVKTTQKRSRVALTLDPSFHKGFRGDFYFTYNLPPETLAAKLSHWKEEFTPVNV